MNGNATQQNRQIAISTALGGDTLVLNRFTIRERLSVPFEIEAELAATDATLDHNKIVGTNATIRLEMGSNGTRYFNGFVSRFIQTGNSGGFARYRATIAPWFWFLTRTADCRVFQRKSAVDIAEDVFGKLNFGPDYYALPSGSYKPRRYCVQYRETDFHLISRLLENEGIYYWFEHQNGKHKLIMADAIGTSTTAKGYEALDFLETLQGRAPTREVVSEWVMERQVQPGSYALKDYDFKKPAEALAGNHDISREHGMAKFAVYDYPGDYFESDQAEQRAKLRLEELQAGHEILQGVTNARGLSAGGVFELKKHPRSEQNRKYLITELSLSADAGEFASGGTGEEFFNCNFTAIPSTVQYRPARIAAKSIIQGIQTATVVGPSGDEIHTDKYARVKVQFHWDRYGKADENSSCWVRVAQDWAGKKWGGIRIPRIGQEVIVEFLEGDPDRPLITGSVYNDTEMPPYELPGKATISGVKSNSSKGGEGFNEIRFEDKKGDEQIFVHGEKNLDVRIKNDAFETIGNNRHLIIEKDQLEHVKNNRDEIVDADHTEKIGKDRHLTISGKEAKAVDGSLSLTVKGDVIEVFKANHSEQTSSDYYLKAENVVIEGMTNVTVKVGQSYIAIESSGIKIGATQIEIEGQGTIEAKSPMTTVKGDGQLTLKGGVIMIN
jgi:type VI secretion system secreted protein VgrG